MMVQPAIVFWLIASFCPYICFCQEDCKGVTLENCTQTISMVSFRPTNSFSCEKYCKINKQCSFFKFTENNGLCELFDSEYRKDCTNISGPLNLDIEKCISTQALSCERVMLTECCFEDSNTTYISSWPKLKSAKACQQACKITTLPICHFWMYHSSTEKCDLYERDKRHCHGVGGPASVSASYCSNKIEMDGGWSEWSSFGDCSISAGGCKRTRHRNCDSPERSERGLPCVGPDTDTEDCEEDKCDGSYLRKCHKPRNIIIMDFLSPLLVICLIVCVYRLQKSLKSTSS